MINKDFKIGFLILHYHVIDKTIACVESIIDKIDTENYEIIIVDNASINGTGKLLESKYDINNQIHVLLNAKNLGFSGGNNVGLKYAIDELSCDFICMLNNDTELMQNDFFNIVLNEYHYSNCAVIAPEMHLLDGSIKSYTMYLINEEELLQEIRRMRKMLLLNFLFIEQTILCIKSIVKKLIKYEKIKEKFIQPKEIVPRKEMVVLHGCCLVFTPEYLKKFHDINNKTFFYGEEELLFIRLVQNGMLSVYNPDLKIFHAEKMATAAISGSNYKKRRMVYTSHLNASHKILEEEYKCYEKLRPYFKKNNGGQYGKIT